MGSDEPAPQPIGARLTIGPWVDVVEKLRRQRPVARCGYSFWIYRIGKRGELPTEESARFQPRFGYRESNSHASIARESYIASKRITPVAELSSDTSHPGPPPDDRGQGDSFSVNRERSQTSTTLIAGARALDPEAWQRLSDDYSSLVYRWCRRAGLTEEDAADLTQEVLTAAWRHIDSFRRDRPGDRLRKWIRAITTNRIRDYWRQRGREATVGGGTSWLQKVHQVAAEDDPRTRSSFAMPRAESADPRLAAIEKVRTIVSDRDWTIFERTVIDELSADEVASELGVSRNVVYLVRSRLLRYVRQAFDGNDLLGNG